MKRVWWVVRIAVIVAASYCIFAPTGTYTFNNVLAEEEGGKCNTSTSCTRNADNACYCPEATIGGPGCTGCFVPNGSTGCGSCSGGPSILD